MAITKTLLKDYIQKTTSLAEALRQTNESLCGNNADGMFVTVWAAFLSLTDGNLVYVNAGHCRPLLKRCNGEYEYLAEYSGFVLAGLEGAQYQQYETVLFLGDMLFQYSDGVTEANNKSSDLYGEERLLDALNKNKMDDPQKTLNMLWNSLPFLQNGFHVPPNKKR